jgi:hypothetical protein
MLPFIPKFLLGSQFLTTHTPTYNWGKTKQKKTAKQALN